MVAENEKKKGLKQALMFLCFSLGAGVIELVSFELLGLFSKNSTWLVMREIISVVLSCLFNFTLNRKYTFKSSNNIYIGMLLYALFYAISSPLWALAMKNVLEKVGMEYDTIVKLIKMLLNFVLDFLYCKFIIFGLANRIKIKK